MTKPNFAIIRVAKIHSRRQLKAAGDHNDRTAIGGIEHAEPTDDTGPLIGDADVRGAWDAKMEAVGLDPKKQRKDAVVALEWVATASPEFFASATVEQRTKWATETIDFLTEQAGGADNVLAVYLHEDETTPHIHALTIPLVQKERKRQGRPRKGRAAPQTAAGPQWGLSAGDIIGGSKHRLEALQDDYAAAVADVGLVRGVPRKETGARNRSPAHWRAEQARLADEARQDRDTARAGLKKSVEAAEWANGLARVVEADAKRIGQAIQFPEYANDPRTGEARRAVAVALAGQMDLAAKPPTPKANERIEKILRRRDAKVPTEWREDPRPPQTPILSNQPTHKRNDEQR